MLTTRRKGAVPISASSVGWLLSVLWKFVVPCSGSCRKPWLRTARASAEVGALNERCRALRAEKHRLRLALQGQPEHAGLATSLAAAVEAHRTLKKQQRQVVRQLEQEYWEVVLASHPDQEADSFQFFRHFARAAPESSPKPLCA